MIDQEAQETFFRAVPLTEQPTKQNDLDVLKKQMANELSARLIQNNRRQSRDNATVSGRLIMKPLLDTTNEETVVNKSPTPLYGMNKQRNHSVGNIQRQLRDQYTYTQTKLSGQRKNSEYNLADVGKDVHKNWAYEFMGTPRRSVATLDDPSRQSMTQSRTFKLLQETLDNGE